jgi:hypothetical protein
MKQADEEIQYVAAVPARFWLFHITSSSKASGCHISTDEPYKKTVNYDWIRFGHAQEGHGCAG